MSKNCFTDNISKLVAIATVAAVGVQGYYSVRHLIDINSEGSSSEAIQKWFRDQHCAKCMREQKRASTDIQRFWRGYRARSRNSSLRESLHQIHEKHKGKKEQSTEEITPQQLSERGERETERSSAEEKASVTSLGSSIRTGKTVSEKAVLERPKESSLSLGSSKRSTKTLGASVEEEQNLNQISDKSVASGKSGLSTKGSKAAREEINHLENEEEQKSKISLASGIPETVTSSVGEKQASMKSLGSSVHTGKTASEKSIVERPQTSSVSLGSSKHSEQKKDVKVSSKESVASGKSGMSKTGTKSTIEEMDHSVNEQQKSKKSLASGISATEKQASVTSLGSSVHTGKAASENILPEGQVTSNTSLGSNKRSHKSLKNPVEENQPSHESLILQDETLVEKNEQESLKSLGHNSADETDAVAEEQMSVKSFESKSSKNKET